jgi:hypothetical protein
MPARSRYSARRRRRRRNSLRAATASSRSSGDMTPEQKTMTEHVLAGKRYSMNGP